MRTGLFTIIVVFSLLCARLGVAQGVNVDVNIGAPPPLVFAAPPDVVVVPSGQSYVYMVPDRIGVYFFGGFWYRYHNGYWFRAQLYSGPWGFVDARFVPAVVVGIPPEYPRFLPPGYYRVHYGDLHSHWRDWDQGRHWHGQEWYRREMRPDIQKERHGQIERYRGPGGAVPGKHSTAAPGSHPPGHTAGPAHGGAPSAAPATHGAAGPGSHPPAPRSTAVAPPATHGTAAPGSHPPGPSAGAAPRATASTAPATHGAAPPGSHPPGPSGSRGTPGATGESHNKGDR